MPSSCTASPRAVRRSVRLSSLWASLLPVASLSHNHMVNNDGLDLQRLRARLIQLEPLPVLRDESLKIYTRHRAFHPGFTPTQAEFCRQFQLLEAAGDGEAMGLCCRAIYKRVATADAWGQEGTPRVFSVSVETVSIAAPADLSLQRQAFKSIVLSNAVFAQLAFAYGLHKDAVPPFIDQTDLESLPVSSIKSLGDCFEAYVGALVAEGRAEEVGIWLRSIFEFLVEEYEQSVRQQLRQEDEVLVPLAGAQRARDLEQTQGACELKLPVAVVLTHGFLLNRCEPSYRTAETVWQPREARVRRDNTCSLRAQATGRARV